MAPNPRVVKAYDAMRSLGIYDKDVKSVLKKLLQLYDRKWELIEEDNYRTLIDAYFELKEDKQAEGKRKAPISYLNGERPKQKLHLVDGDDQVSSPNNSIQGLSVQDPEMPPKTFKQEIIKPSQTSIGDMEPTTSSQTLQTLLSEVEMFSTLPCTAARDRKLRPEKASAAGHCEDPIDEPSNPHIRRKNISSNRHQNELMIPRAEKPKLHLGPVSTSYNALYQIVHKKDGSSACNNNNRTQKGNINIASSPFGEVKISLNCDAALGQPNFHIPDLDAVMKSMEEKYLKAYKIVEPELSMVKLLDDLCESYLKLGLNLNRKRFTLKYANSRNVACLPQKAGTEDDKNSLYFLGDLAKGSENVKISLLDETGREDLPKFNYIPCNIIYQDANVNISLARIADEGCCADCAGDCLSLSFPCACAQETGGEFAYSPQGLLKEEFLTVCMSMKMEPQNHHFVYCQECPLERFKNDNMPEPCKGHLVRKFIKECWRKCGCDMQCGNRIVQRGLRCKLQVYLTREGKGWGVRTLEDLPKGCFVCEYAGEILTNTELYERTVQMSGNDRHTYPVTLDADWGSERVLKDEDALCLDATYNGNVARFINHRCSDANLIDIPVEVETPDRHYYHLALFTNRYVNAYEELTWDYGIDFDDHEHPIKAFECCCGSAFCRDKQQKVFTPSAPSKKDTRKPANKSPSKEKTKKSRATTDKARQKLTFGHVTSPSLDANKRKPSGVLAGEGTAKKGKAVIDLDVAFVSEQAQAFVDSVGTSSNDMVSFRAPTPLESLWANGLDPWSVLPPSFMRSYDESFLTSQDFTKTYDMLGTYLLRSMAAMTAWRDSLKGANPTILQKLKVENQQLQTDLDRFKGIQEELQTSLTASQATIDSKTVKVATSKEELLKLKEECYRMKKDLDAAALARSALEETRSLDQKKLLKLQEELDVATLEKTMLEQKLKGSEEQHAELKQTLSNAREEKKELSEQISTLEDALLEGYQAGFDNALSQVALLSSDLDLSSCDSDKIVKDGKLVVPID